MGLPSRRRRSRRQRETPAWFADFKVKVRNNVPTVPADKKNMDAERVGRQSEATCQRARDREHETRCLDERLGEARRQHGQRKRGTQHVRGKDEQMRERACDAQSREGEVVRDRERWASRSCSRTTSPSR